MGLFVMCSTLGAGAREGPPCNTRAWSLTGAIFAGGADPAGRWACGALGLLGLASGVEWRTLESAYWTTSRLSSTAAPAPATSAVLAVEALSAAARGFSRNENSRTVLPGCSEAGSRKWSSLRGAKGGEVGGPLGGGHQRPPQPPLRHPRGEGSRLWTQRVGFWSGGWAAWAATRQGSLDTLPSGHLRIGTTKPGAPPKTPRLVAPDERAYHALDGGTEGGLGGEMGG